MGAICERMGRISKFEEGTRQIEGINAGSRKEEILPTTARTARGDGMIYLTWEESSQTASWLAEGGWTGTYNRKKS
jgi:hypothetical protein